MPTLSRRRDEGRRAGTAIENSGATIEPLRGTALRFHGSSPVRENLSVRREFRAVARDAVALFASPAVAHDFVAARYGILLLAMTPATLLFTGMLDANGFAAADLLVPELGPNLLEVELHTQAYFTPHQTGATRLGPASEIVLLDVAVP